MAALKAAGAAPLRQLLTCCSRASASSAEGRLLAKGCATSSTCRGQKRQGGTRGKGKNAAPCWGGALREQSRPPAHHPAAALQLQQLRTGGMVPPSPSACSA